MPSALIPLAEGVEEMEAVIVIDVLRRAEWNVVAAGLREGPIKASRGVCLLPDAKWNDVNPDDFDWLLLPGGLGGTQKLIADERVIRALQQHARAGKKIGAICAGPTVLHAAGLIAGRSVTSHPSVREQLGDAKRSDHHVVVDGNLLTSQGPGTSFDFALTVVAVTEGEEKAKRVAEAMILGYTPPG